MMDEIPIQIEGEQKEAKDKRGGRAPGATRHETIPECR
jgi:hypothetical protein